MRPTIREICADGLDALSIALVEKDEFSYTDSHKMVSLAHNAIRLRDTQRLERWQERLGFTRNSLWIQGNLFEGVPECLGTSSDSLLSGALQQ